MTVTTRPTAGRRCAATSCGRYLTPRHQADLCPACLGLSAQPRHPEPRPGTRVAQVPCASTTPHVIYAKVSLPAEPWEAGA